MPQVIGHNFFSTWIPLEKGIENKGKFYWQQRARMSPSTSHLLLLLLCWPRHGQFRPQEGDLMLFFLINVVNFRQVVIRISVIQMPWVTNLIETQTRSTKRVCGLSTNVESWEPVKKACTRNCPGDPLGENETPWQEGLWGVAFSG